MNERMTTAAIIIRDGKVLMGRRGAGHGHEGFWEFPGGKNRYGESCQDTLERELMEELGVHAEVGDFVASCTFCNKDTRYTLHSYLVTLSSYEFTAAVHSSLRWVDPQELATLPMLESDRRISDKVRQML